MKELTNRQQEILDYVIEFMTVYKVPPVLREVAERFKTTSGAIRDHLNLIAKKGYLKIYPNRPAGIVLENADVCPYCEKS